MSRFIITGAHPLEGSLTVHGAKNSILPILAASILCPGTCVIHNCPPLSDVNASVCILEHLGCVVSRTGDTLSVDASNLTNYDIPDDLMREMRSSILFLGAILGRLGQAKLSYPGGCELGPRPIDLHLDALRKLRAIIQDGPDGLFCFSSGLSGSRITLSIPSVGATENAMLAAVAANGTTLILNAAREPEIVDLQSFLQALGAKVSGAGSSTITIEGAQPLHGGEFTVMGDRIVACTYLAAAAACGGDVELDGIDWRHLSAVTAVLSEAGCQISSQPDRVRIQVSERLKAPRPIRTAPYPGFPTDAQAPVMAGLCTAKGSAVFVETIFSSRYHHVDELLRMGANIRTEGQVAILTGVEQLHGARVLAHDLRGGAALIVAALSAQGESMVDGLEHVDRGYYDLDGALRSLGAHIQRTEGKD